MQQVTDVRTRPRPVVLLVLDGWGLSPSWQSNAIVSTRTPTFDYLWKHYPHTVLQSFKLVASDEGVIRSSEIGHASIGSGRIVKDDLTELNLAIDNGQFFDNPTIQAAMDRARENGRAVHLIGLMSEGGIQGSLGHALALVKLAKQRGVTELWLHPITDGLDAEAHSAGSYLQTLEQHLKIEGVGTIGTLLGRSFAMNQDDNWEATLKAYKALMYGEGRTAPSAEAALQAAYANDFGDATLPPTVVVDQSSSEKFVRGRIQPGDVVISWNFRHDGIEQLVRACLDENVLRRFLVSRQAPLCKVAQFVSLTDYRFQLPSLVAAFPASQLTNTLPELIDAHGMFQLRIAEAIKYPHITYFFNGGRTEPFEHESRIIVPTKQVKNAAEYPQMNAAQITEQLERSVRARAHDFILVNLANVDTVAKTGDIVATATAVQVVDEAIRRIANVTIEAGGVLLVTADHGNAEQVRQQHTKGIRHTVAPLPLILVGQALKHDPALETVEKNDVVARMVRSSHTLADVAPTVLELLGIAKPSDMTGTSLLSDLSTR
ncbi:MAG: 2,3-bisphosphoglycerate-independent phosphoglycerate mutase [Patescibacteria group bacterium]